jgi:hypothetical protein
MGETPGHSSAGSRNRGLCELATAGTAPAARAELEIRRVEAPAADDRGAREQTRQAACGPLLCGLKQRSPTPFRRPDQGRGVATLLHGGARGPDEPDPIRAGESTPPLRSPAYSSGLSGPSARTSRTPRTTSLTLLAGAWRNSDWRGVGRQPTSVVVGGLRRSAGYHTPPRQASHRYSDST